MATPKFTVFTATFDRAELISRTYESLRSQTLDDFEWLIVDDGSTDGTDALVRRWQVEAAFPIRYVFQSNQGKHRAYNRALQLASGELFTVLDSDDKIVSQALERLHFHWASIPESARLRYSGVTCLCMDQNSRIVGRRFPADVVDCPHWQADAKYGAIGEKWGCHQTSILRRFPFPEIPGERLCPDALVWNRISRTYLVRHVNEALRVYFRHSRGLTANWTQGLIKSPKNARQFYRECLELDLPVLWKAKRALQYVRYSLHAGATASRIFAESASPGLTATLALPGYASFALDRLRYAHGLDGARVK
jgi:glycosyltransferase involved in cell wall biosynthesis